MKINTRFAVIMSLAIAGSLASTLSQVNAESIPSSAIPDATVTQLAGSPSTVSPNLKQKIRKINPGGSLQNNDFKEAPLKFRESPGFVEFSKSRKLDKISNPAYDKLKPSAAGTLNKIK